MKTFTHRFISLILLIAGISPKSSAQHSAKDGWNGIVSYTYKSTSQSSGSSGTTIFYTEIRVADGKATAFAYEKVTRKGEACRDNRDGYQEGRGEINFSFAVEKRGDSYYIHVDEGMPWLKGSLTICGKNEPIWNNELGMVIEDLKVGTNPDVLVGDSTSIERRPNGDGFIEDEVKIVVNLSRGPIDVELLVFPEKYSEWLPVPGKSEKEPGNSIEFTMKLQAKGGGEPKIKAKVFELELQGTSKEPGIALNAPLQVDGSPAYDMAFVPYAENEVINEGQNQRVKATDGKTGAAMISAYDGGAYSTLVVYAVLENGKRIRGQLMKSGGPDEVLLPKRNKASKIGDAWLAKNGNPSEDEDADKSPGNDNDGDGLTAYEEYRGLFSEGRFRRLDPQKKELGVQLSNNDKSDFETGLKIFSTASGIEVIRLNEHELPASRRLNLNAGTAHRYDQHALKLEKGNLSPKVLGRNEPHNVLHKTPKKSERVVIDVEQANKQYILQDAANKAGGITTPYTLAENIAVTVAHEVAHGVYLDHHGPSSNDEINRVANASSITSFVIYGIDGSEITKRPFSIDGPIGVPGNDESGDLSCIMAYTSAYQWLFVRSPVQLTYYAVPPLPVGKRFCVSHTGTGINANGKFFADAKNGNCLSKIKVRDE